MHCWRSDGNVCSNVLLIYELFLVAWWKGLRDLADSARSYVETDDDIHRLVLKKVTYGDAGTYTVKVSNVYGNQKSYCTVRVSNIYGPVKPFDNFEFKWYRYSK